MTCDMCERIEKKKNLLYNDGEIVIFIPDEAIVKGSLIIAPVKHYPILEAVPDNIVKKMYKIANKAGIACFEALGAQGSNILIQNGIAAGQEMPHVLLNVVPRRENDGLQLQWQPKQISEEEMSTVELQLKESISDLGEEDSTEEVKEKETEETKEKPVVKKKEEDYRVKSLRRIP